MTIEAVNLIFYGFLKTSHDQKRNYHSGKAYPNDYNRNVVNGGCKSLLLISTDSFGYEIRKVQGLMLTFSDMDSVQNRITYVHNQHYEDSKFVLSKGEKRNSF
jgi:hypothetical protein